VNIIQLVEGQEGGEYLVGSFIPYFLVTSISHLGLDETIVFESRIRLLWQKG
jgi:hypothetical protein